MPRKYKISVGVVALTSGSAPTLVPPIRRIVHTTHGLS